MSKNHKLTDLVEFWLETYRTAHYSARTVETYGSLVGGFLRWFEAEEGQAARTADLGRGDNGAKLVNRYLGYQRAQQLAASTSQTTRAAIVQFAKWLHAEAYIEQQTASDAKKIKLPQRITRTLSEEEIAAVKAAIVQNSIYPARDLLLFRIPLATGIRRTELAELRVSELTLWDKQGRAVAGASARIVGKGDKERIVGLGRHLATDLRRYLQDRDIDPADDPSADYVFLSRGGTPLSPTAIGSLYGRWEHWTGIRHVHPHATRHTFATEFIEEGGSTLELMQLLGHTDPTHTQRYVHLAKSTAVVERQRTLSREERRDNRRATLMRPALNRRQPVNDAPAAPERARTGTRRTRG